MNQTTITELDEFASYMRTLDRSDKTLGGYIRDLRAFYRWFELTNGKACEVREITPSDIREYRQYMQLQLRLAASSVNRRLAAIKAFLRWAVESGKITGNPANNIKLISKQKLSPRWLEKRDIYALEREAERNCQNARTSAAKFLAERDQAILILLMNTGLRISELCALDLADVTLSERKGSVIVRSGKGEKQRTIPLNDVSRKALRSWLDVRGNTNEDLNSPLFRDRVGQRITTSGVHRRLAELGRRAGVELHAHLLRHTFAKRLVDSGVSLEKVATLMGHSDLNVTRVYITPGERDLERAVEALE